MDKIMTINVRTLPPDTVEGHTGKVLMIPFTASAQGEFFCGETKGCCVDTQYITPDGQFSLSARYILEGTDKDGNKCRIFIENNGTSLENCKPRIITDSPALAFLEKCELSAKVESTGGTVKIIVYAEQTR
ncbi:MAG: hypothetical protein IK093_16020 [Ruminiclostridium sp.]|nr:hypothetical protein [Ruminiclostridium sp.]